MQKNANVAELADALDSGSSVFTDVQVQVLSFAPTIKNHYISGFLKTQHVVFLASFYPALMILKMVNFFKCT